MTARVVRHRPGKGYHFVRLATNGQVIATSEHYETHRPCLGGIDSSNATPTPAVHDVTPPGSKEG